MHLKRFRRHWRFQLRHKIRLIATVGLCLVLVNRAASAIEEVISSLASISDLSLREWKFKPEDIPGAESPAFDDSDWQVANPEFEWGHQPVCWLRKTFVVPSEIGGIPVSGSEITLRIGVDDDGECYVNGVLKQKFHWGDCEVKLTDHAQPGDRYVIVVKGLNAQGPGRLLFAYLDYSVLKEVKNEAARLVADLQVSKIFVDFQKDESTRALCRDALQRAIDILDIGALTSGDKARFLASVPAARKELEQIQTLIKGYTVHLVGHAHIDMNWLWLWPETVEVCKNTFSTMIKIMDEYPDFRFSQSQASTYVAMEENYPDLFAQIQRRVRSGAWEVTGGTWVEGDMNMASGESIVRQILYAKRYFLEKFGVEPEICWEPDTFGHAWTIPQILAKSGIKYYYFCRCGRNEPIFWWEAPDGSRVLAYNRGWYNERINDTIGIVPLELAQRYGIKDGMVVYGVGDHGGGPTREDLNKALELRKRQIYPQVRFDTAKGFFESLLAQKSNFPVIRDELNFEFRGCYTTHSDIKKMNRTLENLLPTAEAFCAIAAPFGAKYPAADFVRAWRNTCFNQFHDIFDGTAIHDSYAYSRQLYEDAFGVGQSALQSALRVIVDKIDTRGHGMPVVVFNPLSWRRTDVVRIPCPKEMESRGFVVSDGTGAVMPSERVGEEILFTAKNVPALGYKTYYIRPGQPIQEHVAEENVLENEFLRLVVDRESGTITSIYDKAARREVLPVQGKAGQLQLLFEEPRGMSAWNIGRIDRVENIERAESVKRLSSNVVVVRHVFNKSTFIQEISLPPGLRRIDVKVSVDWHEQATRDTAGPLLKVVIPVNVKDGKAVFDIPFGSIERAANGDEVPALKWVDVSSADYGVSLLNDCKYGHDVKPGAIRLTLLRCSYEPDPMPDQGQHVIRYSIYPHLGDWRRSDTPRRGLELNNPLIPVFTNRHPGTLPEELTFIEIAPSNLILTCLKQAEGSNDLILRFYECEGREGTALIRLRVPAKAIYETDLAERDLGKPAIPIRSGQVKVPFGKWEIKTLRIRR